MVNLFDVANTVAEHGFISATQLSQLLKVQPSSLDVMLSHLIRLGKIEKMQAQAQQSGCAQGTCKSCVSSSCATPIAVYAIKKSPSALNTHFTKSVE